MGRSLAALERTECEVTGGAPWLLAGRYQAKPPAPAALMSLNESKKNSAPLLGEFKEDECKEEELVGFLPPASLLWGLNYRVPSPAGPRPSLMASLQSTTQMSPIPLSWVGATNPPPPTHRPAALTSKPGAPGGPMGPSSP